MIALRCIGVPTGMKAVAVMIDRHLVHGHWLPRAAIVSQKVGSGISQATATTVELGHMRHLAAKI